MNFIVIITAAVVGWFVVGVWGIIAGIVGALVGILIGDRLGSRFTHKYGVLIWRDGRLRLVPVTGDHLVPRVSDRGLRYMPEIRGEYEIVELYESSAADGAHVWLKVDGERGTAHLTIESAGKLRDQLDYLIVHHYQRGS